MYIYVLYSGHKCVDFKAKYLQIPGETGTPVSTTYLITKGQERSISSRQLAGGTDGMVIRAYRHLRHPLQF